MKVLKKTGQAGTVESNDILVSVSPGNQGSGVVVNLTSPVEKQYGEQIRTVIADTLTVCGITDVVVAANDRGALDCTIKARVETAVARGIE